MVCGYGNIGSLSLCYAFVSTWNVHLLRRSCSSPSEHYERTCSLELFYIGKLSVCVFRFVCCAVCESSVKRRFSFRCKRSHTLNAVQIIWLSLVGWQLLLSNSFLRERPPYGVPVSLANRHLRPGHFRKQHSNTRSYTSRAFHCIEFPIRSFVCEDNNSGGNTIHSLLEFQTSRSAQKCTNDSRFVLLNHDYR